MAELQSGSYEYNPKKINLNKTLCRDVFHSMKSQAEKKGIDFSYICSEELFIKADEYSICNIFQIIIENAIKYTKNGKIEVRILQNEENKISATISDTGIGISENYLSKIFSPFSQEEQGYTRRYEGNGLGLALVKKYCDLNNAEIKVESAKGKGTTFQIIFQN
jgi:signal transduction histidine kinase